MILGYLSRAKQKMFTTIGSIELGFKSGASRVILHREYATDTFDTLFKHIKLGGGEGGVVIIMFSVF